MVAMRDRSKTLANFALRHPGPELIVQCIVGAWDKKQEASM
jgi:hypothetical protein